VRLSDGSVIYVRVDGADDPDNDADMPYMPYCDMCRKHHGCNATAHNPFVCHCCGRGLRTIDGTSETSPKIGSLELSYEGRRHRLAHICGACYERLRQVMADTIRELGNGG
jgi:hypothetical protein